MVDSINFNSSINSLFAQNQLAKTNKSLMDAFAKLSSGLQINKASDNPAGLVISEYLRAQLAGLSRAVENTQDSYNMLSIAEGAMNEASSMLSRARELALQAANTGATTPEQTQANQQELNSILDSINRIAGATNYAGKSLLDGSAGNLSDVNPLEFADLNIGNIELSQAEGATFFEAKVDFTGAGDHPAEQANVQTMALDTNGDGIVDNGFTATVSGNKGTEQIDIVAGQKLTDVIATVNALTEKTGVEGAINAAGTGVEFKSAEYGAAQMVSVVDTSGTNMLDNGAGVGTAGKADVGADIRATVTVQQYAGQLGDTTTPVGAAQSFTVQGEGRELDFSEYLQDSGGVNLSEKTTYTVEATEAFNASGGSATFQVGGGALNFQLAEGEGGRTAFSLQSIDTGTLGREAGAALESVRGGGANDLASNPLMALEIIDQAISDISEQRADIGAFQKNALEPNINALNVAMENITATESSIRDLNMAEGMMNFTKGQIMSNAGLQVLKNINLASQNALRLLE